MSLSETDCLGYRNFKQILFPLVAKFFIIIVWLGNYYY